MEGRHFDQLARAVAARGSRRRLLGALLTGGLGSLRLHTTSADEESGTAIADASGGDHNRATVVEPAPSQNDRDRDRDRAHDQDQDRAHDRGQDRDQPRDRDSDDDRHTNNGGPVGPACALCGLVEGPRTCDSGQTVFCDTSTVALCCEFGQDVECCPDCAAPTPTPIARCCTPGVDCAPAGGPCAGLDFGAVGCQCARDAHCAPGAVCRNPCTPGVPCDPTGGICDT
jgi:hypothetical protein